VAGVSPLRRLFLAHRWPQWAALLYLLLVTGALAWLLADRINQSDRDAAQARAQAVAFCTKTRGEALAPLTPTSTEFARNDVRGAIFAFRLGDCDQYVGALPMDQVDPEAFRPAPTPTPTGR
jgi:hypothetical protein